MYKALYTFKKNKTKKKKNNTCAKINKNSPMLIIKPGEGTEWSQTLCKGFRFFHHFAWIISNISIGMHMIVISNEVSINKNISLFPLLLFARGMFMSDQS